VKILVFHGYLLRGTGSNVYNASLARALAALNHEVHLLCQDRRAAELDWVDAVGDWEGGELSVERLRDPAAPGSVTVYTPDIGGLLPVYVADRYEGFEVKTFPELSEAELEGYIDANAAAVRDVVAAAGAPDAALANHLVMGPAVLARAGLQFVAKVHGSDLSYTVLPHPDRFVPYAEEGLAAASAALVGSSHTAKDLWKAVPSSEERTYLGPPGVDTESFRQLDPAAATAELRALAADLRELDADTGGGAFDRDPAEGAAALDWFADAGAEGPRVIFVGKLIVNKGIDLLAAAWPLVVARHPGASLLITGFGGFRDGLEQLIAALADGDIDAARSLAAEGRALEGGEPGGLPILESFLADPPAGYEEAARKAAGSVRIAGRLEHGEVARALPAAEILVMPSTFPEAFGMVAVEAAASGVLPVSAAHSGMREVSRRLGEAVSPEVAGLLSFDAAPGAVEAIASRLNGWLDLPESDRAAARRGLASRAAELWSWERVARDVIGASRGELGGLTRLREADQ
jgi:glycosyltransferase involved in cell wall biosynthesis